MRCRHCRDTGMIPDTDDICDCEAGDALRPDCELHCDDGVILVGDGGPDLRDGYCDCIKGERLRDEHERAREP